MSKHDKFILTPMSTILEEAIQASSGIGSGIETYPLCDYIMQSIFLKMTGYQEQKMKCIAWEIATNNFEYRRRLLNNDDKLGECSTYDSKNKIYKALFKQIKSIDSNYEIEQSIKVRIKNNSFNKVKDMFMDTNLVTWNKKLFNDFLESKLIKETQYLNNSNNLLENIIQEKYDEIYKQRNRLAHNTQSYQQNLPDFKMLSIEKEYSRNYFLWFAILLLIDNIFIELYKIYIDLFENCIV
ncbi:hypothetical protein [Thomasclavelia ramosa]|uniref:hypothetical protein n=1 Tax=Thomasclavelia ramosa TaxID=1547 RepID=UPI00398450C7